MLREEDSKDDSWIRSNEQNKDVSNEKANAFYSNNMCIVAV